MGRPTKYRPEFVRVVVEHARTTGQSLTAFAGLIGVGRETITEWASVHPEFSIAVRAAKAARALWIESAAAQETNAPQMNYKLLALKNCAAEDWREQQEVKMGGLPGAPPVAVAHMTPEQAYHYLINGGEFPSS